MPRILTWFVFGNLLDPCRYEWLKLKLVNLSCDLRVDPLLCGTRPDLSRQRWSYVDADLFDSEPTSSFLVRFSIVSFRSSSKQPNLNLKNYIILKIKEKKRR